MVKQAEKALNIIHNWYGEMNEESVPATVYSVW
jgi:hypothetical protein